MALIVEDAYLIYKHTSPSGKSYIGQTKNYNTNGAWNKGIPQTPEAKIKQQNTREMNKMNKQIYLCLITSLYMEMILC